MHRPPIQSRLLRVANGRWSFRVQANLNDITSIRQIPTTHIAKNPKMLRPTIARITAQSGARRAFSSTPARPLARITIVGNLTDSPELQATSTGRELIRYSVASNSGPRDESGNQKVSFFRVTAFPPEGPKRDFIQNLQKG